MSKPKKNYFRDAFIKHGGKEVSFTVKELEGFLNTSCYWHGPGDPSSNLVQSVFTAAREKCRGLTEEAAFELTAKALNVDVKKVHSSLEWQDAYMRWHDGEPLKK